jgi:NAD-dependent DNA ligase
MKPAIIDIPGIGPAAEAKLLDHGFRKLKKLAATSVEKLASVPGFGTVRAGKVIAAASVLLTSATGNKANEDRDRKDSQAEYGGKEKKRKKDKKDRKGKRSEKNKKDKKRKKGKKDK